MIGPLAIVIGVLGIWALVRGKAGPVLDAITGNSGFSTSLDNSLGNMSIGGTSGVSSSGSTSGSKTVTGNNSSSTDIGSHSVLMNGIVTTVDKTYAQMSDAEKGAANAFAKQIGNVG